MIRLGLSVFSGLLLTASFPTLEWFPLVFLGLVPLFKALEGQTLRKAFLLGFAAGCAHFATLLYWIFHVVNHYGALNPALSVLLVCMLVAFLALYPACFGLVCRWAVGRGVSLFWVAPPAWVGLEWIQGHFLSGLPWEFLGYSLYRRLTLIQAADVLGVYGVSFLILCVNVAVYHLVFSGKPWKNRVLSVELVSAACLLAAFAVYGQVSLARVRGMSDAAPALRVGLAQGNIAQTLKWSESFQDTTLDIYATLTRDLAQGGASVVVWPETAAPFYFGHDSERSSRVRAIARRNDISLVFGSPAVRRDGAGLRYTNRAYVLDPAGNVMDYYDKSHLVPYGEYVPLKKWFAFLGKIVAEVGDFAPGQAGKPLSLDGVRLGPLICYESIFPELSRKARLNGAQVLVNMTNDAWFERTSAPYQHFSMLVFRSVETRAFAIRAANTGISGVIHPSGKVLEETGIFTTAAVNATVGLTRETTWYTRHGDVFAYACMLVALVQTIRAYARNRKTRRI